jgi:hypothetical protein
MYTVLSVCLAIVGLLTLRRTLRRPGPRTLSTIVNSLGYLIGALSIALWPESHSAAVDTVARTPGLGRLVNDTAATLAAVCQFGFITTLARQWGRRATIAVTAYSVLLTSIVALWIALHIAIGPAFGRALYTGYAGGPVAVRVWNTLVGLTILYTCALTFLGYTRASEKIHNRYPRLTTTAGTAVWALFTLYGGLVVTQIAAVWAGLGDLGLKQYLSPIVVICVVVALGTTMVVLFGPRLMQRAGSFVAYVRRWASLSQKEARVDRGIAHLERLLRDNTNAAGVAIDQRVHMDAYADAGAIEAVDARLAADGYSPYHRKAGRQAVRYLVLNRANAARPFYDEEQHAEEDDDDDIGVAGIGTSDAAHGEADTKDEDEADARDLALLADLSRQEQEHIYLHADAARIAGHVILLRGDERLATAQLSELDARPAPHSWHHAVAAAIIEVLRERERAQSSQGPAGPSPVIAQAMDVAQRTARRDLAPHGGS